MSVRASSRIATSTREAQPAEVRSGGRVLGHKEAVEQPVRLEGDVEEKAPLLAKEMFGQGVLERKERVPNFQQLGGRISR